jgi:hypothetical protein
VHTRCKVGGSLRQWSIRLLPQRTQSGFRASNKKNSTASQRSDLCLSPLQVKRRAQDRLCTPGFTQVLSDWPPSSALSSCGPALCTRTYKAPAHQRKRSLDADHAFDPAPYHRCQNDVHDRVSARAPHSSEDIKRSLIPTDLFSPEPWRRNPLIRPAGCPSQTRVSNSHKIPKTPKQEVHLLWPRIVTLAAFPPSLGNTTGSLVYVGTLNDSTTNTGRVLCSYRHLRRIFLHQVWSKDSKPRKVGKRLS